jgi:hypothetical protein
MEVSDEWHALLARKVVERPHPEWTLSRVSHLIYGHLDVAVACRGWVIPDIAMESTGMTQDPKLEVR